MTGCNCDHRADDPRGRARRFAAAYRELMAERDAAQARRRERRTILAAAVAEGKATGWIEKATQ